MTVQERHETLGADERRPHPYKHIIVALDGSEMAEAILPYVEPLARAFKSRITCVCAVQPLTSRYGSEIGLAGMGGGVMIVALEDAQDLTHKEDKSYLDLVRSRLKAAGLDVRCREPEGRPAEAIIAIARQEGADLIAMTTHGRSGIGRALVGSVADEVLRHAPCPVLIVHPPD